MKASQEAGLSRTVDNGQFFRTRAVNWSVDRPLEVLFFGWFPKRVAQHHMVKVEPVLGKSDAVSTPLFSTNCFTAVAREVPAPYNRCLLRRTYMTRTSVRCNPKRSPLVSALCVIQQGMNTAVHGDPPIPGSTVPRHFLTCESGHGHRCAKRNVCGKDTR